MIPGEVISCNDKITLNSDKLSIEIKVANLGDRPVQVGSHFHFFEVNKALSFNRRLAFGRRLDIPSGTAVRFEPGCQKTVSLIDFGGKKCAIGFNGLVNGIASSDSLDESLRKITQEGFNNID